jgi:N-acetylmuramoyl-L-alanine amidase
MMRNIIQISSPNFDRRPLGYIIDHVILHYTEISFEETLAKFCDTEHIVSAHYLIKEDGQIVAFVPEALRARHAGISNFRDRNNFNDFSIGIELVNSGKEQFSSMQMQSCIELCLSLKRKYNIPSENFLGHSDIAPSRKIDPGLFFDWDLLQRYNLGITFPVMQNLDDLDQILSSKEDESEYVKKLQNQLAKFGYDIGITGVFDKQTSDVVRAFQSHFSQKSIVSRFGHEYYSLDNYFLWDRRSDLILSQLLH